MRLEGCIALKITDVHTETAAMVEKVAQQETCNK